MLWQGKKPKVVAAAKPTKKKGAALSSSKVAERPSSGGGASSSDAQGGGGSSSRSGGAVANAQATFRAEAARQGQAAAAKVSGGVAAKVDDEGPTRRRANPAPRTASAVPASKQPSRRDGDHALDDLIGDLDDSDGDESASFVPTARASHHLAPMRSLGGESVAHCVFLHFFSPPRPACVARSPVLSSSVSSSLRDATLARRRPLAVALRVPLIIKRPHLGTRVGCDGTPPSVGFQEVSTHIISHNVVYSRRISNQLDFKTHTTNNLVAKRRATQNDEGNDARRESVFQVGACKQSESKVGTRYVVEIGSTYRLKVEHALWQRLLLNRLKPLSQSPLDSNPLPESSRVDSSGLLYKVEGKEKKLERVNFSTNDVATSRVATRQASTSLQCC